MATSDNWGQGSKNNDNGWGKGASTNNNSWGSIHAKTYGHPTTNLTGSGGFVGLLDQVPGAAAAYSLRLLRSDYSGSAIRVRRSSDNAEQDIGFVNSELDTASLLSFVGAGDGFVTSWYDQSGNGNDATQGSAASQPQIVSSGSVIVDSNSLPQVQPDGVNDFLEVNNTGILIPNNSLIYTVSSYTNAADSVLFSSVESSNYNNCISIGSNFLGTNSGVMSVRLGGVIGVRGLYSESDGGYSNGDKVLTNTLIKSAFDNSDIIFNGAPPDGSVSHRANVNTPGCFIFRAVNFFGTTEAQEIIIYNGSSSDQSSNRTGIETNINNFYNIY